MCSFTFQVTIRVRVRPMVRVKLWLKVRVWLTLTIAFVSVHHLPFLSVPCVFVVFVDRYF